MRAFEGLQHGGRRTFFVEADVHEMPELLKLKPSKANAEHHARFRERMAEGDDFYFGEEHEITSLKGVRERFDNGWMRGAERALKLAEGMERTLSQPQAIRRRPVWGEQGDEYSWERLYDGHYDTPWRSMSKRVSTGVPIIRIVAPFGGHAGMTAEQLFWSGAASIALSNMLEDAGYQTQITGLSVNVAGGLMAVVCNLKGPSEYLRPDALASVLAYGGTYRTMVFHAYTAIPWAVGGGLGSNGRPTDLVPACVENGLMEAPHITLPDCYYEDQALAAVKKGLRDLEDANLAAIEEDL